MKSTLQKITAAAKKIRSGRPSIKWTDAIKLASKQLKTGKRKTIATVSGIKKKAAPKKKAARKKAAPTTATPFTNTIKWQSAKPGKLAGIDKGSIVTKLRTELETKRIYESRLIDMLNVARQKINGAKVQAAARKDAALYRRLIKACSANISNLKKLL